ncbi:MAG: GNAT family N-acetyltransferase [Cellulophaga sp.]|uniref:GNAT family N-acetyltransferase n=1 Tax=Cellulophaga sp. TaxID=1972202 RepID=UPI0032663945
MEDIKIRKATIEDTSEIVTLIKAALGENIKKSDDIWIWKHYKNPFGESLIYVATFNNKIVGMRSFMQWSWINSKQDYKTLRAVDSSVDTKFRRKGIFSNLTKFTLKEANAEGFDFVFNTPNEKSIGAYLKLGWVVNRKVKVNLLLSPFSVFSSTKKLGNFSKKAKNIIINEVKSFSKTSSKEQLSTPVTLPFLKWRYLENPIVDYNYLINGNILLIYRKKKIKFITECRIVDILILNNSEVTENDIKKAITILSNKYIITTLSSNIYKKLFHVNFPHIVFNYKHNGPNLTTKEINIEKTNYDILLDNKSDYWDYSLGDMELF